MQTFARSRFHQFSRYFFSKSYSPPPMCAQRTKISSFLQEVFVQNLDNIAMLLPKSDIKFASLVAYNFSKFNIQDDRLAELINNRIREDMANMTPDLAYELVLNLRDIITPENPEIYQMIGEYVQRYYYLFDMEQLEVMNKVFSGMGTRVFYSMDSLFEQSQGPRGQQRMTQEVLDYYSIKVPQDEIGVIIHPYHKLVEVKFKKTGKVLTLAGMTHEDWTTVNRAKDMIHDNPFDFYLMELGPLTNADMAKQNNIPKETNNKKKKKGKESVIDRFLSEYTEKKETGDRNPLLNYFDKYDRIALFDGPLLEWYVENILKNNELFTINEAERVVYSENTGLRKPNELETILYQLHMLGKKDIKVVFSDLKVYDEINILNSQMTLAQTKDLFKYARFLWLNEFIRWGISVNKKGCPACSKTHNEPPNDVLNLISHKRYDFAVRERFMAKQIIDALENYDEHKNYIGFYGEDHIYEILKYICEHYSKHSLADKLPNTMTDEEKFKRFLRYDEIRPGHVMVDEKLDKGENTNKFSMIMSLFQLNRPKFYDIPYEANLDWQLYDILKKEYLKFLSLDSFVVDTKKHWQRNKQEEKCYAVNLMFYQTTPPENK